MHASAAPTEAVEHDRTAKPTTTVTASTHFATIQPCFAKPHGVEMPYRTAVAIRSGIHGPINFRRNASIVSCVSALVSPSEAPPSRLSAKSTMSPPSHTDAAARCTRSIVCFVIFFALGNFIGRSLAAFVVVPTCLTLRAFNRFRLSVRRVVREWRLRKQLGICLYGEQFEPWRTPAAHTIGLCR